MGFLDFLSTNKEDRQTLSKEIEHVVDFSNFEIISDYIYEKSGIIDLDKRALVFTRLKQFAQDSDIFTTNKFLDNMKNDTEFYQEVINIVTVNETYFFREKHELEWLVDYAKNSNKNLDILSLPSSSGEETYSILIMLDMAGVDLNRVNITGYDINSQAVVDAKNGYYNSHSLHKVESDVIAKYFTKTSENLYQICNQFRIKANFEQKNIFELKNDKNKYDIILSRNMFIYFNMQKRAEAVDVIANLLKYDGIYIKGHADNIDSHPKIESVQFGIYKKKVFHGVV